ncbi:DUF5627 domain-containing protein [Bacteroides sp. OttesenSCG-928-J23]|nr:DUF5627 domain-containing protein [Bacteroides sp. OttesenSCG-928-J23]
MKKIILTLMAIGVLFASCKNSDWEFPDYGETTVYFAKQSPVRTITLGDDVYDTSLDNEHKCQIMAVMGGVYENKTNRIVNIAVDASLCDGLSFADGEQVTPMPASYYTLADNQIVIPKGRVLGGVEVQLNDAFFNDPKSIKNTYVIPVKITDAENIDKVLEKQDYTLYAIKYINKWHGYWLSSGTDKIDDNGIVSTVDRKPQYVEKYDVRTLKTSAYKQVIYPLSTVVKVYNEKNELINKELNAELILTFDNDDKCTITCTTPDCTATGAGTWKYQAAKKAWGDKDRDLLELSYELTYYYTQKDGGPTLYKKYTCEDTLIARDRGSKLETFTPKSN